MVVWALVEFIHCERCLIVKLSFSTIRENPVHDSIKMAMWILNRQKCILLCDTLPLTRRCFRFDDIFHHRLQQKLSKSQLPVQPGMMISSLWAHRRFSVRAFVDVPVCLPITLFSFLIREDKNVGIPEDEVSGMLWFIQVTSWNTKPCFFYICSAVVQVRRSNSNNQRLKQFEKLLSFSFLASQEWKFFWIFKHYLIGSCLIPPTKTPFNSMVWGVIGLKWK